MRHAVIKSFSIFILFAIAGSLVYSNTIDSPFVFDDEPRIEENLAIRMSELSFSSIMKAAFGKNTASSRPVGNISFALNYYLHQYDLKGYHIFNILVHVAAGFLLYNFLKITLIIHRQGTNTICDYNSDKEYRPQSGTDGGNTCFSMMAFFPSFIWFVHPVHTQSVTYIIQRLNSMAAMFYLLSLFLYIQGRLVQKRQLFTQGQNETVNDLWSLKKKSYYILFFGAAIAWIIALGSKQTAATLPFIILLYEWFFFQDLSRDWLKHKLKYVFGIFALFAIIAFIYLGMDPLQNLISKADYANEEFTLIERVLTQPRVIIYYLSLLFYPYPGRLNLDYDFPLSHSLLDPVTTTLTLCGILCLLVLAVNIAKKQRLISFCILWFLGNLVIESSIIPLAIIFEHRTYLPSMLAFLPAALLAYRFIKYRRIVSGIFCMVIIIFAIWTYQRNNVWRDGITLWNDIVQKSPEKARPHNNLGAELEDAGLLDKAVEHYMHALRINPDYSDASVNLGAVLKQKGRINEAIEYYLDALRIDYNNPKAHYNLGIALEEKNQPDEAIQHYFQALKIKPEYSDASINLGIALSQKGRLDEAIQHFSIALQTEPDSFDIYNNLGNALNQKGLLDKAIEHYLKALSINPDSANTYNNLGIALVRKGDIREAVDKFNEALRIRPDFTDALNNREKALLQEKEKF